MTRSQKTLEKKRELLNVEAVSSNIEMMTVLLLALIEFGKKLNSSQD
jgi:hypothetical protein